MKWLSGGKIMFLIVTIILIMFIFVYVLTYIIDPTTITYMRIKNFDTTSIKEISENYISELNVEISKPIVYRFVEFVHVDSFAKKLSKELILLGTFHEWNNTYYIDISQDLYKMNELSNTVKHEIRHMIVQELKYKKIIDLTKYTEEIAREKNEIYNNLFISGVELLKNNQMEGK